MNISIVTLGTIGNVKERSARFNNHSGVLIDSSLLFDFGEKKFLKENPKAIFITHLHPDHACFMSQDTGKIKVPVYAPAFYEERPEVQRFNKPIRISKFKITPIPTVHTFKTPSQGYLIEGKGKKIFYSGDIITIEKRHLTKMKPVDVVITDASYFRRGGVVWKFDSKMAGHNGVRELMDLFRPFTHRIIFMHFGTWFVVDARGGRKKIMELGDEQLSTEVAHDGKEFLV